MQKCLKEEVGSSGPLNSGVHCAGAGGSEASTGWMPPVIPPAAFPKDTDTALPPGARGLLCSGPGPRTLIYSPGALLPLQITFEISKQEDWQIPIWIIVGSTLGGLLLLALLVLALWKVRTPHGGVGGWGVASWLVGPCLGFQPLGSVASPHVLLPMGAGTCLASFAELTCCHSTQPITAG